MADKKIIVVVGATGAQGGGLARAILADANRLFTVRALTRTPDSEKSKALAAAGAEVVQGNIDELDTLKRAFDGAHGAYCVTFFWDHFSAERETAEAHLMAQAAKEAGVSHVIWSTLEDTRRWVPLENDRMPTLKGKYKVPHYDGKGEANQAFTEAGVPTTLLHTSFYWENFIFFGSGPQRGPDGTLALTFPLGDKKMPSIASEDIGRCAYGIFKKGGSMVGRSIGIAGAHLSGAEMAAGLSKALGQPVRYNDVSPEVYRGFGFPGADDLGNMFQFKRDFESDYRAARSIEVSRELNPALQTYDEWLEVNASRIPIS